MAIIDPYTQLRGIETIPGAGAQEYKTKFLNEYQDIAAQSSADLNRGKLSYTDSPIFNRGYEAWDPSSFGSTLISNYAVPVGNLISKGLEPFTGDYTITSGKAGGIGGPTAAGFAEHIKGPILSGTATPDEKLKFANTFGHEMSHLGWQYKPKDERISVGGKTEGGGLSALMGSVSGDYAGEEQWNYMHDLMYAPRAYSYEHYESDLKNLKDQLASGKISKEEFNKKGKAIGERVQSEGLALPGKDYLTEKGLINKGDLSYTPKAHDTIAWSGLTSADKKAIGFGVNPFEDTKAAGQWYKQQKYRKMSQAKKQAQMQETIRQHEAADAAAKTKADAKAKADAAAHKEAQATGGDYHSGHQSTVGGQTTDWGSESAMIARGGLAQHAPRYANGGLIDFFRYGGFIG